MSEKLSKEDFVLQAIKRLRDESKSKGIHVKYSGFNSAFKEYFGEEARATVDKMVKEGTIQSQFRKGGVMIYLTGEAPVQKDVLNQIIEEAS